MQLHLPSSLLTFDYQHDRVTDRVRTVTIEAEPWFFGVDGCKILEIKNPSDAYSRLDEDDLGTTEGVDSSKRRQKFTIVNEFGLYDIILQSRKAEARQFKRWVTHEVIPQIRRTGSFGGHGLPIFVRRFNDNWDRVQPGYFSVISELFIRVYGRFERAGHLLAEYGPDGKELRPDISVGKTFPKWLGTNHPQFTKSFTTYRHLLPDGIEVDARQYLLSVLPQFIDFVESVWLFKHAPAYLQYRDRTALQVLPKLLSAQRAPYVPAAATLLSAPTHTIK